MRKKKNDFDKNKNCFFRNNMIQYNKKEEEYV